VTESTEGTVIKTEEVTMIKTAEDTVTETVMSTASTKKGIKRMIYRNPMSECKEDGWTRRCL